MRRRSPKRTCVRRSLLFAGLVSIGVVFAAGARARDFSDVEIRRVDLGPGLAMLVGAGGNIGVSAGPDGVFLVDDQFAPLTDKIRAAVAGIRDEPIRFVVNTHWHGDHTGGNENLGEAGAVIVAHADVRRRMNVEQVLRLRDRTVPASPPTALPVITFADGVTFHVNGDELAVFHVGPAHTDGDSVIHWKGANVIHTGDVFVNGGYPFVDIDSGGRVDGIIAAGERVLAISDAETRIIPGHGPLATRADLERFLAMLRAARAAIAAELAEGKSADEVVAAKPTAQWDAEWGNGFMNGDAFTRFVATSLGAR